MSNYLCGAGEKGALPAPTHGSSRSPRLLCGLKEALEEAGRSYGEGPYLWGNYRLLPRSEWPEAPAPDPAGESMETVAYADLLDEANGEKGGHAAPTSQAACRPGQGRRGPVLQPVLC